MCFVSDLTKHVIQHQAGPLVPNSDVCLQLSLTSPSASSSTFLSPKLPLKVGPDGKVNLLNTMDVLTCMEGERRFYVNGPIARGLEYTVTVHCSGGGGIWYFEEAIVWGECEAG